MSLKFRKILFYFCLLAFIAFCPILIAYSLGYYLNPGTKKIISTGSIFLSGLPQKSFVSIDNSPFNQKTPTYLDNLEQGEYNIRVSKEGFTEWSKSLQVKGHLLTIAENILLLPKNFEPAEIAFNLEWAEFSPSRKNAVGFKKDSSELIVINLSINEFPIVSSVDSQNKIIYLKKETIRWSRDEKNISFFAELENGQKGYFTAARNQEEKLSLSQIVDLKNSPNIESFWSGSDENIFSYIENQNLFQIHIHNKKTIKLDFNARSFIAADNKLYFIQQESGLIYFAQDPWIILSTDSRPGEKRQFTKAPIPDYLAQNAYSLFFLDSENLLVYNKEEKHLYLAKEEEIEEIHKNCKGFEISPSKKKILVLDDHAIEILDIKREENSAKTKQLVARTEKEIKKAIWFDNFHIAYLLSSGEGFIAELDGRSNRNIIKVPQEGIEDFWIELSGKTQYYPIFYYLKNNALYGIDWNKENDFSLLFDGILPEIL